MMNPSQYTMAGQASTMYATEQYQPNTYVTTTTTTTTKPVTNLAPGAITLAPQPVTQLKTQPYTVNDYKSGFGIFTFVMSVLSSICWFVGAVLNIAALSCFLQDPIFYFRSVYVLFIIGFSFWLLAVTLNAIPSFGGFSRTHRSGYLMAHLLYAALTFAAMALFISGAGCFLSRYESTNVAGNVVWIIAGALWLAGVFVRDLGLRYDLQNTYKNYPRDNNYAQNAVIASNDGQKSLNSKTTHFKLHLASVWANSILTATYFVVAVLFLIGAILFDSAARILVSNQPLRTAYGVMWLVATILVFFGSLFQCVARR